MQVWYQHFAARSAMFAPLRSLSAVIEGAAWPTPAQLNAMAHCGASVSGGGRPLRFTRLSGQPAPGAAAYELHIHDEGVVPLREANWHDLFNALAWLAFPRAKAALNRAHADELRAQPGGVRNSRRDALTLFDESGVLVLSSSSAVLERIRAFEWKRVFWEERDTLLATTRFLVFGHALYEKALSPYVGMTGHALLLETPDGCDLPDPSALLAQADALAANAMPARITQPRDLSPLPLLGVPGWWDANNDAVFYENAGYFRAGRTGKAERIGKGAGSRQAERAKAAG